MASLHLNLTPDLQARLKLRASEAGFDNVEQYAQAVLSADVEGLLLDEATERLLLQRIDDKSPGLELTPSLKREFVEQVRERAPV